MTAYGTVDALKAKLNITDVASDADLERALIAASRAVDEATGRRYYATTQTRRYTSAEVDGLYLHVGTDLLAVTTLKNGDGSTIPAAGYRLEPRNRSPYDRIRLVQPYYWWFLDGDSEIEVAGSWGFAASAPDNVVEAVMILAVIYWKRKDAPFGVLGNPEVGELTRIARHDPQVKSLLPAPRLVIA